MGLPSDTGYEVIDAKENTKQTTLNVPDASDILDEESLRGHVKDVLTEMVVPRLLKGGQTRTPSDATQALDSLETITSEEIETFAKVLRSKTYLDVESNLKHFLSQGFDGASLLLQLIAPSAQHLGLLWERDECSLVEVTQALILLHRASY